MSNFAKHHPICDAAGLSFDMAMTLRDMNLYGNLCKVEERRKGGGWRADWRHDQNVFGGKGVQFAATLRALARRGLIEIRHAGTVAVLTDAGRALYVEIAHEVAPSK